MPNNNSKIKIAKLVLRYNLLRKSLSMNGIKGFRKFLNSRKLYRTIQTTLLLLVVITISLFFLNKYKQNKPKKLTLALHKKYYNQQENDSFSPEIILQETELYILDKNNFKNCLIKTKESQLFPNQDKTICKDVICKLITNKNIIATLNAPLAYINHKAKNLFLPGMIQGTFKEWTIKEHDVYYNSSDHTITATHSILNSKSGISIKANKSTINLKNETAIFKNGVFSQIKQNRKNSKILKKQ